MTKLEEKLIELGYKYKGVFGTRTIIYKKNFFFHSWFVLMDLFEYKIVNTDFGTPILNLIAYIRYKKDLEELSKYEI